MKKCEEMRELISLYLDNELDDNLKKEFEEHIESCKECRNELLEISIIADLCRNTPEEDLPENFNRDLHEKLIAEKEKMDENKKVIILKKYITIFSSAAALLLIAFICGGIWLSSWKLKSSLNDTAAPQAKSESEALDKNIKNDDQVTLDKGYGRKYSDSSLSTPAVNGTVGVATGAGGENSYSVQATGESKSDSVTVRSVVPTGNGGLHSTVEAGSVPSVNSVMAFNNDLQTPAPVNSDTRVTITSNEIPGMKSNNAHAEKKSSKIEISSEDPYAQTEKIREYATDCQGEIITFSQPSITTSQDSIQNTIYLRVKNSLYDKLIEFLNSGFGSENLAIGEITSEDITKKVNELNSTLEELDTKIDQAKVTGTPPDSEYLKNLENERNQVNKDLETYNNESEYTYVMITIKSK